MADALFLFSLQRSACMQKYWTATATAHGCRQLDALLLTSHLGSAVREPGGTSC